MTQNLLKLNDGKTDIICMSSPYNAKSLKTPGLQIAESFITPSGSMREPGVIFDKFLNMNDQVTTVCVRQLDKYTISNIQSLLGSWSGYLLSEIQTNIP